MKDEPGPRYITCHKCGHPGGTLVKDGDLYLHQDEAWCKVLKNRPREDGIKQKGIT